LVIGDQCVDQSAWTEEGVKGCGDDNGRKHEGNGGQSTQEGFATEVEAGEEVGGGESKEEREEGGEDGLVESEEYYVLCVAQVFECEGFGREGEEENFGKRKEESDDEEGERENPESSSS